MAERIDGNFAPQLKPCPFCGWHMNVTGDQRDVVYPIAKRDAMVHDLRAALAELVAVKDLKERIERTADEFRIPGSATIEEGNRLYREFLDRLSTMKADYTNRQPKAWAAARAVLGTAGVLPTDQTQQEKTR